MHKPISAALIAVLFLLAVPATFSNGASSSSSSLSVDNANAAYPSVIFFSGYYWYVENGEQPNNPGPNYWSNNPENVWVDENGWLHLKITYRDGKWRCAELTSLNTFSYGTYAFYVASRIDSFDKNVVLGMFAYRDDSREVDIELSKWGIEDNSNAWFTVQPPPYVDGRNQKAFNVALSGDYSTHYFTWSRRSISFESFHGHYPIGEQPQSNIIESFTSYTRTSAYGVRAHINLWLYNGQAPSDGMPAEVVIRSFQFSR